MVRRSTSVLVALIATCAHAQTLGRFGYTPFPQVPGFKVDASGFRASSEGADTLRFDKPLSAFSAYSISDRQALSLGPFVDGCPSQLRFNLRAPGFEMFFPRTLRLRLSSIQAPIVSWKEGSVTEGVPTPTDSWFLVSFQDAQPPILLVFEEEQSHLVVRGSPGNWTISSAPGYKGWVRASLPLGHKRSAAANPAELGAQVAAVREDEGFWSGSAPTLNDFSVKSDESSLTAVWTFDRPGALVPIPALLAKSGGYPIQILTGIKRTQANLTEGPVAHTTEPKLVIRFPMQRIPFGRSLTIGSRPTSPIIDASPFSVPGLCNLALDSLLPDRDERLLAATQTVTDEFYARSRRFAEPYSKLKFPFPASGEGIDILAAHALVQQARAVGGERSGNADDPFMQCAARIDWATWLVWADDHAVSRRASAILGIASALSDEPERRILGAMLQAGLASERALGVYRETHGFTAPDVDLVDPFFTLREGIFMTEQNSFVLSLLSEVRISTPQRIVAQSVDEGVLVTFKPEKSGMVRLEFEVGRPVLASGVSNLRYLQSNQYLGRLVVDCIAEASGECAFLLKSPGWTVPLPPTIVPPMYSDSR